MRLKTCRCITSLFDNVWFRKSCAYLIRLQSRFEFPAGNRSGPGSESFGYSDTYVCVDGGLLQLGSKLCVFMTGSQNASHLAAIRGNKATLAAGLFPSSRPPMSGAGGRVAGGGAARTLTGHSFLQSSSLQRAPCSFLQRGFQA